MIVLVLMPENHVYYAAYPMLADCQTVLPRAVVTTITRSLFAPKNWFHVIYLVLAFDFTGQFS
jgi:hypothetical protein